MYQAAYSVLERDIEREILPMCRHEGKSLSTTSLPTLLDLGHPASFGSISGIALTLWNVLAGGHIRTDAEEEARRQSGENGRSLFGSTRLESFPTWERTEDEKKMCAALEKVAAEVGAKHITAGTPMPIRMSRAVHVC